MEKERKTRTLINNLTKGIQVNISFRLVDFISSFMLTDLFQVVFKTLTSVEFINYLIASVIAGAIASVVLVQILSSLH